MTQTRRENYEMWIGVAQRAIEDGYAGDAIYVLRDLPETAEHDLDGIAWAMDQHGGNLSDAKWLLKTLMERVNNERE